MAGISQEVRQEIVRLVRKGLPDSEIAKQLGLKRNIVVYHRVRLVGRRLPGERFPSVPKIEINHERFMELYNQGLTDKKIAEAFGCSKSVICKYRHDNGIPAVNRERPYKPDHERRSETLDKLAAMYRRRAMAQKKIFEGAKVTLKERPSVKTGESMIYRGTVRYINKHHFTIEVNAGYRQCWQWADIDAGLIKVV